MFTGLLKTFWPMIQAFLLGQGRALLATAGGALIADGVLQKTQLDDWIGSGFFLMTLGFSAFDKFVVNAKIKTALETRPPGTVAGSPNSQSFAASGTALPSTQVTMAPIPNP